LPPTPHRVRLLLSERGVIALTATPLSPAPESLRLCVSNVVINSRDAFLYHKTTARTPYQQALREAQAQGCFEAVLTNERGEVTEGSFTTIFVERDGVLLTPPLSAGLLPGILRAELLKSGRAREATLYPADLRSADRLYIGNSLRGLMAVSELASRNNPYPQP
jgi:para-aminobenzoate synthetase/4-amino-4-deoxychorismate lyase